MRSVLLAAIGLVFAGGSYGLSRLILGAPASYAVNDDLTSALQAARQPARSEPASDPQPAVSAAPVAPAQVPETTARFARALETLYRPQGQAPVQQNSAPALRDLSNAAIGLAHGREAQILAQGGGEPGSRLQAFNAIREGGHSALDELALFMHRLPPDAAEERSELIGVVERLGRESEAHGLVAKHALEQAITAPEGWSEGARRAAYLSYTALEFDPEERRRLWSELSRRATSEEEKEAVRQLEPQVPGQPAVVDSVPERGEIQPEAFDGPEARETGMSGPE